MSGIPKALTAQRRKTAIRMAQQGKSTKLIAEELGVGMAAVNTYLRDADVPVTATLNRRNVQRRREMIQQLAAEGYGEDAIAGRVGMKVEAVRATLHKQGRPTLAMRLGNQRRVDYDRAMEGIVLGAMPSDEAVGAIDWAALDRAQLEDWSARLSTAITRLTALRSRLRKEMAHGNAA